MKRKFRAAYVTRSARIGALYVALTYLSTVLGLSSGVIQFRFSEALCILPIFMAEAVPGLFIGCLISNIMASGVPMDLILGSLATLLGAVCARAMRALPDKLLPLATLPNIISNTLIVPLVLIFAYGAPQGYGYIAATVFIGEAVCGGLGGYALLSVIKKSGIDRLLG